MLTPQQYEAGKRAVTGNGAALFRSLKEIASEEPPKEGIQTGIPIIDEVAGGLYPNRLNMFVGYLSHGKTAGMLTTVVNNIPQELRVLFVSCDDSDTDVLTKLLAMRHGIRIEDVMANGSTWRNEMIREFEHHIRIAANPAGDYNYDQLVMLIEQYKRDFGDYPELVCFDYLGLLATPGREEDGYSMISKQARAFKRVIRAYRHTVFLVTHQCNRDIVRGHVKGLETKHVEMGGVKETDGIMVGFRRRVDTEDLDDTEMAIEERYPTTNINIIKNKVNGKKTSIPGHRYAIDPISGLIRPRTHEEMHFVPVNTLRQREEEVRFKSASVHDRFTAE